MTKTDTPLAARLRSGHSIRFDRIGRGRQLCVRAERGTLWITIDHRIDDIVVEAGSNRVIDRAAGITVSALSGTAVLTAVTLTSPRHPSWIDRLAAFVRGPAAVVEA